MNDKKQKAGPGEEYDYEGYMIKTQLRRMAAQSQELIASIDNKEQFPSWIQSKVTLASEYMDSVYDFYNYSDYSIVSEESDKENEDDNDEQLELPNMIFINES